MYEVIGKLYNSRHTTWSTSLSELRGQHAQLLDESRDARPRPGEAAATRDGVVGAPDDDDQRTPRRGASTCGNPSLLPISGAMLSATRRLRVRPLRRRETTHGGAPPGGGQT